MIPIVGGALLFFSGLSFWYLLPKNGQVHPLVTIPSIEAYLPVMIISGASLGLVMLLSLLL
jgi:hypothetical protein